MKILKIYKNIVPTYLELETTLTKLNFKKKQKGQNIIYNNSKSKATIVLPKKKNEDFVNKTHFATFSYQLELLGVIEKENDLAKMIEKLRFEQNSAVA